MNGRFTAIRLMQQVGVPFYYVARLVSSQLWGASATDPAIFIAVPCILALAALAASYGPARHAAKMNPVTALRTE
jgi:putative ABC transport system permease protein